MGVFLALVDDAADITRAKIFARWPLYDLDTFSIERIARIGSEIAQPVGIDILPRLQAANTELVPVQAAGTFAGGHGNPGTLASA